MSQREEFVRYYDDIGNMAKACREFDITRKTGYKWWKRFQKNGLDGLEDRSRRPENSPNRTPEEMEQAVLSVRASKEGTWGGRKIRKYLKNQGYDNVPAASTITSILHRHDEIDPDESQKREEYQRFEADEPNERWQMDFKGHFSVEGGRCHPLTILDDHSRFSVGLKACLRENYETVKPHLKELFRRYGCPDQMLMDNGKPWGHSPQHRHTKLTVWLMELGIQIRHSRPYHPETMGKDERFHRTFKDAVQAKCEHRQFAQCQSVFDRWRDEYNEERPHEALEMEVPAKRWEPSSKRFPEEIHSWDYLKYPDVRKANGTGHISFQNHRYQVGAGFEGKRVGLKETDQNNKVDVYFRQFYIKTLNLKEDIIGQ